MTKKTSKVDIGDIKFDSDLDFTIDSFEVFDSTKNKKSRTPVQDVIRGAAVGAKSQLKSGSFYNEVAKKSLPRSYTKITEELERSKQTFSETIREASRLVKPDLRRIGAQVDALVPEEARRIKKWTEKFKSPAAARQAMSQEAYQDQAIALAQHEIFSKLQVASEYKEARDRAEQRIKDKIDTKRFAANANILGNIQDNMARLASYTTNVNASYQKKMLELQYRSYFVMAELLKNTAKYNDLFKGYFEAIKHNTGLPDFAKITKSERFKQMALDRVFGGIQQGFAGGLKRAGNRAMGYVRGLQGHLSTGSNMLEQFSMMQQMQADFAAAGAGESPYHEGGKTLGGIGMQLLGNKLGRKISGRVPKNNRLTRGLARTSRFLNDPTADVNRLQNTKRYKDMMAKDGVMGDFARFLNMFVDDLKSPAEDRNITSGSKGGMDAAFFDNRTHKSITEVIPGYLSRALAELRAIRLGSRELDANNITFDWRRERFTTSRQAKRDAIKDVMKVSNMESGNYELGKLAHAFTGQNLSGKQGRDAKRFLYSMSTKTDMDYTTGAMFDTKEFKTLDPQTQKLLRDSIGAKQSTEQGRGFIAGTMRDQRQQTSNRVASAKTMIHKLIKDQRAPELLEAGLIVPNDKGGYDINLEKFHQYMSKTGITGKTEKLKEFKTGIIPMNEEGKHDYVGERAGYTYNHGTGLYEKTKRHLGDSDRNLKTEIRSNSKSAGGSILDKLMKLGTYTYKYRGKRNDGSRHQGYMAQEVNKAFGDQAAPKGVKIDHGYMNSMNTEAIKELYRSQKGKAGDAANAILHSIDRRLAELSAIAKLQAGANPADSRSRGLFGDTVSLAGRYAKFGIVEGSKGVVRGAKFMDGTARILGGGIRGVGNLAGRVISKNKDKVLSGFERLLSDAMSLTGLAYRGARAVTTNIIPAALKGITGFMGGARDRFNNFLAKPKDLYVPGIKEPVLIGDMFAKGMYVTEEGKAILDLNDLKKVKGAIYKKTGEVVVTASQMAQGLYDRDGTKLKFMMTSSKDLLLGAAGWVGGKMLGGFKKLMKLKLPKINIPGLPMIFGRTPRLLEQILKLLQKWDKRGFGGGGASTGGGGGPAMSGPSMMPMPGAADFMGPMAPSGGSAIRMMGNAGRSIRDFLTSDKTKAGFEKAKQSKAAKRLGALGGGKVGKFAGKLGGKLSMLGGLAGGLLGGGQADGAQSDQGGQTAQPQPQRQGTNFFARMMKNMNRIAPGQRAWNDTEGTGRRSGSWMTRLEEQKERDGNKDAGAAPAAPAEPRWKKDDGVMGIMSKLAGFLTSNVGGLFKMARGAMGMLFKVPGLLTKGAGKLIGGSARMVTGTLRAIGRPVVGQLGRIAASGAGRFIAAQAARTAVMAGAASAVSGGVVGTALAGVSAGITALGAVLASPVVVGALVAGAAAYGGYKLYKYMTRDKADEFQKVRYQQYGLNLSEHERYIHMVANLERYLLDGRVGYQNQFNTTNKKAHLLSGKIDAKALVSMFDIEPEDNEGVNMFTSWFEGRFKPFFLHHASTLYNVDPKASMFNISKDVKDPNKFIEVVKGLKFEDGPYDYLDPPLRDMRTLYNNKTSVDSDIKVMIDRAVDLASKSTTKKPDLKKPDKLPLANQTAQKSEREAAKVMAAKQLDAQARHAKKLEELQQKAAMADAGRRAGSAYVSDDHESEKMGKGSGGQAMERDNSTTSITGSKDLKMAGGSVIDGASAMKYIKLKDSSVKLDGMNPSVLRNFMGMVQEYGDQTGNTVQVNSAWRSFAAQEAEWRKNPGKAAKPGGSLHGHGLAIDINTVDANKMEEMGLMRKYGFTRPVGGETWHIEPAGIQADLAAAKSSSSLATQMVDASLFKGGGGLGTIPGSKMGTRNKGLQMSLYETGAKMPEQLPVAKISDKLAVASGQMGNPSAPANDGSYAQSVVSMAERRRLAPSASTGGSQTAPYSLTRNGQDTIDISPKSDDLEKPVSGATASADTSTAGDDVNPTDRQGVLDTIAKYAKKAGVNSKDMQVFAAVESGLDPQARASTSSASGPFQFIKSTWRGSMDKYGDKYGLTGNESPMNVKASTLLASEHMKSNLSVVKSVAPNAGLVEAYLAHFLGASGAKSLLGANPNAIAADVFPAAAASNRAVFFDGGKPRTIKQIYAYVANKLETAAKSYGISGVSVSKTMPNSGSADGGQAGSGSVRTSIATPSASPTDGDYSPPSTSTRPTPPKRQMSAAAPSYVSNRTSDTRNESGDSPMRELLSVANNTLNIHQAQLNTMNEIRDMMKEIVKARVSQPSSPAPQQDKRAIRTEQMTPVVDISRKRTA